MTAKRLFCFAIIILLNTVKQNSTVKHKNIIIIISIAWPAGAVTSLQQHIATAGSTPQSSTGELLESRRIWSIHRARGLPGRRLQFGPGGRPTDKSMSLRSAMCAETSLSSRAMCPETEMRRAARISPNGVRPLRACTSTSLMKSDQRIPSIWRWHFMWKASTLSLRLDVQVSPWDGTGLLVYYVPPCIQTPWTPESSLCESRTARRSTRYIVVMRCSSLRACWSISVEHSARSSQEPQSDSYNFHAPS